MHFRSIRWHRGQVAIIALLVTAALILVGLSLASRTTKEISLATQTKESNKVFSSSETGAEKAISQVIDALDKQESIPTTDLQGVINDADNNTQTTYSITPQTSLSMKVLKGAKVVVNLNQAGQVYSGTLTVDWAKEASCADRASLIVTVYYRDNGKIASRYLAFGPDPAGAGCTQHNDHFIKATNVTDDSGYKDSFTLNVTNNDLLVSFKPLYHDTDLKVVGSPALPVQQYTIISRGVNQAGDTNETRAVQIDYALPTAPSILDYAVYSNDKLNTSK